MAKLDDVAVDISVVLGNTSMPIHQVLRLGRGAIIELDASEDDDVHILANNLPVAARHRGGERQPHRRRGQAASAALARRRLTAARDLVRHGPNCYIRAVARPDGRATTPHAVVAELADALA